jgi:hypothetical protein
MALQVNVLLEFLVPTERLQPLPDQLAHLVEQIAQVTDDKNPPRNDGESAIVPGMKQ